MFNNIKVNIILIWKDENIYINYKIISFNIE